MKCLQESPVRRIRRASAHNGHFHQPFITPFRFAIPLQSQSGRNQPKK
jgi:hypothetical protein